MKKAAKGTEIKISASGSDAREAVDSLIRFIGILD